MRKFISLVFILCVLGSTGAWYGNRHHKKPKPTPKIVKPIPKISQAPKKSAGNSDVVILLDGTEQQETVIKIDGKHIHFKGGKIARNKAKKVRVVLECATVEILFSTPPVQPVIKIIRPKAPTTP